MTDPQIVRYGRSPEALWRDAGSTVVVTTASDPDVHELLGGAGLVWSELADPRTISELLEQLAATYDVSGEVIEQQVSGVLETMRGLGVVEEIRGSSI